MRIEDKEMRRHAHRKLGLFNRFGRSERGVAAVEWAFIGPVLILLLLIFIELSLMMFAHQMVEGGVRDASRWGITGQADAGGQSREEYVAKVIKENTMGLIDEADITVTTKIYPTFSDVGKGEPFNDANGNGKYDAGESFTDLNTNGVWDKDQGVTGAGGGGDIVQYKVAYKWSVLSPMLQPFADANGKFSFETAIVVNNEPF